MIIFNLGFFSTLLSILGGIGWIWVWWFSKYKTGHDMRIQAGIISLGATWVMFFFASTLQDTEPTSLEIVGRIFIIIGLWCCMPLLKKKGV